LALALRRVVHFALKCRTGFVKSPDLSGICWMVKNLLFNINALSNCLKNRQLGEVRQKQGKFDAPEKFSAKLSTKAVDFFPLAAPRLSLQPAARINVSQRPLSA
jgi:hypothetical protein